MHRGRRGWFGAIRTSRPARITPRRTGNHQKGQADMSTVASAPESPKPLVVNVSFPCTLTTPAFGPSQPFVANSPAKAAYVDALAAELDAQEEDVRTRPVSAVRLSGGASIMSADKVCALTRRLRKTLAVQPRAQIAIDADPLTVGTPSLTDWTSCGVNRVNLAVLSVRDEELSALGVRHRREHVQNALLFLEKFHLNDVSATLLFGLPGQTRASWRESLEAMATTGAAHICVRPLAERRPEEASQLPGPEERAGLLAEAREVLAREGYEEYLVGSFVRKEEPHARDAFELGLREGADLLGLGAGAASHLDGLAYENVCDFDAYVQHAADFEAIVRNPRREEEAATQARAAQGRLDALAGVPAAGLAPEARTWLDEGVAAGRLTCENGTYALTDAGRLARLEELGAEVLL